MTRIATTECPRDAFQGLPTFIPTETKVAYLSSLVRAGFRRIDFGSFVSPKAIPQMADTREVFQALPATENLYLIGIIANLRGAQALIDASNTRDDLSIAAGGYPLSVNETFQKRNTNKSLNQAWESLATIIDTCRDADVETVVYLSMAFGNPYDEPHTPDRVVEFAQRAVDLGAATIQLADTVGVATPDQVRETFAQVRQAIPDTPLGVHLHATPTTLREKALAAVEAGCTLFDSAIGGIGGCPFAEDDLVGNMDTSLLLNVLREAGHDVTPTADALADSEARCNEIIQTYGSQA